MMTDHTPAALHQIAAPVVSVFPLASGYFKLIVQAPEIAAVARPGQFAQIRVSPPGSIDPLLPRPISIYRADALTGDVAFIVKAVGRGTQLLAKCIPDHKLTLMGPIGNGFTIPEDIHRLALIAGGVGMPPLFFLAEYLLRKQRRKLHISLFYGGRTAAELLEVEQWRTLGAATYLTTDDGSQGVRGVVTDAFTAIHGQSPYDFLAACGPKPMLRAVQRIAVDAGIPGQLSLEERMACGVGACLGCVCVTTTGKKRVCVDGPVFNLDEVLFDA